MVILPLVSLLPYDCDSYYFRRASVTLPNNGRGDIFLFPKTFVPTGSTQVDFPPTPVGIAAGTSWRITNATNNTIDFTYNIALATLPNIDSLG